MNQNSESLNQFRQQKHDSKNKPNGDASAACLIKKAAFVILTAGGSRPSPRMAANQLPGSCRLKGAKQLDLRVTEEGWWLEVMTTLTLTRP